MSTKIIKSIKITIYTQLLKYDWNNLAHFFVKELKKPQHKSHIKLFEVKKKHQLTFNIPCQLKINKKKNTTF